MLSHAIYRPRPTDRQLLGLETLLSSYHFLRADRKTAHQTAAVPGWRSLGSLRSLGMTDRVGRRDSGVRAGTGSGTGIPGWQRSWSARKTLYDANSISSPSSWRSVGRGRSMVCESTYDCPLPPSGSRGRGPWSGRGSQRVKPRLVSPFEKRRLFGKGQGFLRVVCPKAGFYLPKWQRPKVGDPVGRRRWRLRRDDRHSKMSGCQTKEIVGMTGQGPGRPSPGAKKRRSRAPPLFLLIWR